VTDTKLNPKQERFAREYMIDQSATDAAKRAGYSAKTAGQLGWQLLQHPSISARIAELRDEQYQRLHMSADEVLAEAAKVARFNLGDFLFITPQGDPYIDLTNATPEQKAALAEATIEDFTEGRGDDARDVRRVKIKAHNKMHAIELIMKRHKLLTDRIEIDTTEDFDKWLEAANKRVKVA
jgi:phage terminase small subunit